MRTIKLFASYYKPYLKMFFTDLICALTISGVDISFPLILRYCIYDLFLKDKGQILQLLPMIALGLALMYIVRFFARFYVTAQGHIMGAYMESDMRRDLFDQYQRLSFSYYDRNNTGVLMSRMVSDLFDISELAHHGPENLFIATIKFIGSFVIMSMIFFPLAAILFVVTIVMVIVGTMQNKVMRATFAENRQKIGEINANLNDSLGGIRVVQSFANEDIEKEKFDRSNQAFLTSKRKNYYAMGRFHSINNFFQGVLYLTLIAGGGWFVANKHLEPAELATFALYINVFVSPIEMLVELTEMLQKGFSGFKRFEEIILEVPEIVDAKDAIELEEVKGELAFEDVSFQYGNDEEKVLYDIQFKVEPGKRIALVGPSGGGKSTICSLISRFYDVTKGSVKIDGKDVRGLKLKSLRNSIGFVQQDVYLFNGTIAQNLSYGKPNASMEEIIEAAKKANLYEFIESLPDRYDTFVGERGTRLSGGQKQRISIARVFLKNPKILILDEATSALDNESEKIVQNSLEELCKGRTCITIAHRLSTIRGADEIMVIDGGRLTERGSHEELMALNKVYAKYYRLQFADEVAGNESTYVDEVAGKKSTDVDEAAFRKE